MTETKPRCPVCGSTQLVKVGMKQTAKGLRQRWYCKNPKHGETGRWTTDPQRGHHKKKVG